PDEDLKAELAATEAIWLLRQGRPEEVWKLMQRLYEKGDPALWAVLRALLRSGDEIAILIAWNFMQRI
uniref:RC_I_1 n=1 Tax=synthetic construct TaxID=32630 RepID=UPI002493CFDA|nr:Chain 0, RC_I_1 [synthetic construct]8F54_1 Chain 1, RC_I_1 [synthetic construct]8F54_2 Chain 2, RC_I_1 [synthetic construct]8F54_3 Chain 3, RC_I_1 [synthetic construct]8F54_4 Chain 4, RC_I_1 [synthetic construct]8F54_5 Chain 5, RC_I_1 [synthetic construct]8F54_6 Chain 6, RC_I_1 [synthetic construct]8F54_7 Chain 7, RC_I_1 [synthetic construct]8F54_A Chain A, RC_I_1 [synthetic construct]8F54_B Chain B, RC_I_1 [synthetic construct]8F54_C Chain C, RC_I_1 [synthetic construct]8F54_D Chain